MKYGKLKILKEIIGVYDASGKLRKRVECECECGKIKTIRIENLKSGNTQSCGCIKHGMSESRIYYIWDAMIQRCTNPNYINYHNYGGRDISVCDTWRDNFINFYNDMKYGYSDDLTLDRIDVNGNYCKKNCRWATNKEQNRNRRDNIYYEYYGQKLIIPEIAELENIKIVTLRSYISRHIDISIYEAVAKIKSNIKIYAKAKTIELIKD